MQAGRGTKRSRSEAAPEDEFAHLFATDSGAGGASIEPSISAEAKAAVAAAADVADEIPDLDAGQVKRLLAGLDKAIGVNTVQRAKWSDSPAKFMGSELALHEAVEGLTVLGAEPALYGVALEAGLVPSVAGLLGHANLDIAQDALSLLAELTDPEGVQEEAEEEGNLALVASLATPQGIGSVAATLARVCAPDASAGEHAGVNAALRLLDHILEVAPESGPVLAGCAPLLGWLLAALAAPASSSNALFVSEVLGGMLTSTAAAKAAGDTDLVGVEGQEAFPRLQPGEGAVEALLSTLAPHCRKRRGGGELGVQGEETIANAFTALRSCMLVPDNAHRFRRAEGILLMLKAVSSRVPAAPHALQLLDFAIAGNPTSAVNFVTEGGLGVAFAVFAGSGAGAVRKASGNATAGAYQEAGISILSTLALHLPPSSTERLRWSAKWLEGGCAKVARLCDLITAYTAKVASGDKRLAGAAVDAEEEAGAYGVDLNEDEAVYLRRLSGGLFTLQKLDTIAAVLAVAPGANPAVREALWQGLYTAGGSLSRVALRLAEMATRAGEGDTTADTVRQLADALASFAAGGGAVEG